MKSRQTEVPVHVLLINIKQQIPLKSDIAPDMVGWLNASTVCKHLLRGIVLDLKLICINKMILNRN